MGRRRGRPRLTTTGGGGGGGARGRPRKLQNTQLQDPLVLDKPRPEKPYTDIYPDLDTTRQLRVLFQSSSHVSSAPNKKEQVLVRRPVFHTIENAASDDKLFTMPQGYIRSFVAEGAPILDEGDTPFVATAQSPTDLAVEYDMDEADACFLDHLNGLRRQAVSEDVFETTMTLLEREWYKLERRMPPRKKPAMMEHELPDADDQKCVICDDAECDNSNAIVFCDGCDIAVHQECYGVPFIPEGDWLCRLCSESRRRRFKISCVFCPNKLGAFKQTENGSWAHLLCALWLPETSVADLAYMEPICGVSQVPKSRFSHLVCYICRERMGACIQCAHKGCFQAFHPTCARKARLCMQMDAGIAGAVYNAGTTTRVFCHRHSPHDYTVDVESHLREAQTFSLKQKKFLASLAVKHKTIPLVKYPKWKTAQGTPAIPARIANKVKEQLKVFRIANLDEYLSSVCRYWTLKRQQRRGAALIKRYQIALEGQRKAPSSREDLEMQALACRAQLSQLEKLQHVVAAVVDRERIKLQIVETEQKSTDNVYFTATRYILPIWTSFQKQVKALVSTNNLLDATILLDATNLLDTMNNKVQLRQYATLAQFESDLNALVLSLSHFGITKQLSKLHSAACQRLEKSKLAWDTLPHWNHLIDFRSFDPQGTHLSDEEWIGYRLAQAAGLYNDTPTRLLRSANN